MADILVLLSQSIQRLDEIGGPDAEPLRLSLVDIRNEVKQHVSSDIFEKFDIKDDFTALINHLAGLPIQPSDVKLDLREILTKLNSTDQKTLETRLKLKANEYQLKLTDNEIKSLAATIYQGLHHPSSAPVHIILPPSGKHDAAPISGGKKETKSAAATATLDSAMAMGAKTDHVKIVIPATPPPSKAKTVEVKTAPSSMPMREYRYTLDQTALKNSTNKVFEEWRLTYSKDKDTSDCLLQLGKDAKRVLKINHRYVFDREKTQPSDLDAKTQVTKLLGDKFTSKAQHLIASHYSQTPIGISTAPVVQAIGFKGADATSNDPKVNFQSKSLSDEEKKALIDADLYQEGDHTFIKVIIKKLPITDNEDNRLGSLHGPIEVLLKLEEKGFTVQYIKTDSPIIKDAFLNQQISANMVRLYAGAPLVFENAKLRFSKTHTNTIEKLQGSKEIKEETPELVDVFTRVLELFKENNALYWIRIKNEQGFLRLLLDNVNRALTLENLTQLLQKASERNIIDLDTVKKDEDLGLTPKGTPPPREELAAKMIFGVMDAKQLPDPTPKQLIAQISRIHNPDLMHNEAVKAFEVLEKDPSHINLMRFYFAAYRQGKYDPTYSVYLKKLQNILQINHTLLGITKSQASVINNLKLFYDHIDHKKEHMDEWGLSKVDRLYIGADLKFDRQVRNKQTPDDTIQRLQLSSADMPELVSMITLLQKDQGLYWLTVLKPDEFVMLLEDNINADLTIGKLTELLQKAKDDGIIRFSGVASDRELGLLRKETPSRAEIAAHIMLAKLDAEDSLTPMPSRLVTQIQCIREEMPPGLAEAFDALQDNPDDVKNIFKFYIAAYIEGRQPESKTYSTYFQKIQDIFNTNHALLGIPRTHDINELYEKIAEQAGTHPELRDYIIDQAQDAFARRNELSAVNALRIIRAMDAPAMAKFNKSIKGLPDGYKLTAADHGYGRLKELYELYRIRTPRTTLQYEKDFLEKILPMNIQTLEEIVNHLPPSDSLISSRLSLSRNLEKVSASEIKTAILKAYAEGAKAINPTEMATRLFVAAQTERFRSEMSKTGDTLNAKQLDELRNEFTALAKVQLSPTPHPGALLTTREVFAEFRKKLEKEASKDEHEAKDHKHVNPDTIGGMLVTQLSHPDETKRKSGFESLKEIALQLPIKKQMEFIRSLAPPPPAELAVLDKLYSKYEVIEKEVEAKLKKIAEKRAELYRDINDLKLQLSDEKSEFRKRKIEHAIELLAKKLKKTALSKKEQKKIKARFKKNNQDAIERTLKAMYQRWVDNPLSRRNDQAQWTQSLRTLFKAPAGYPDKFFNARFADMHDRRHPTKTALRKKIEEQHIGMEDALFVSPKKGGANDPGELGGNYLMCYRDATGRLRTNTVFFNQTTDPTGQPNVRENSAAVMAAHMMTDIIGDNAANGFFALRPGGQRNNPNDMYVASIFFDDYNDSHVLAHKVQGIKDVPKRGKAKRGAQDINSGRSYLPRVKKYLSGNPAFQPGLRRLVSDGRNPLVKSVISAESLGKALMASLLVGNYQVHSENVGVAQIGGQDQFGILDFGGAFRRAFHKKGLFGTVEVKHGTFERQVMPDNPSGEGLKYETCYFLAYPEDVRLSRAFIEGIDFVAGRPRDTLVTSITGAVDNAMRVLGEKAFKEHFADELDTTKRHLDSPKAKTDFKTTVSDFLCERILARQLSIREFAIESRLRNIYHDAKENRNDYKIEELIRDNPLYFKYVRTPGNGLRSLKPAEQERLRERLKKVEPEDPLAKEFEKLLSPPPPPSHTPNPTPTLVIERLIKLAEEKRVKLDNTLSHFLEDAKNKQYEQKDMSIVIQACDEVYRVMRQHELRLDTENVNQLYSAEHKDCLGNRLLEKIYKADSDEKNAEKQAVNAVNVIFELVGHLSPTDHDNFLRSLRREFQINEDDDAWFELYERHRLERDPTIRAQYQQDIYQKFKNECLKQIGSRHIDQWKNILRAIPTDPHPNNLNNDIFTRPVITLATNHPTQAELRAHMSRNDLDYRFVAPKGFGGAQEAGPRGGWYVGILKKADGSFMTQRVMIKREKKPKKNMIESLAGRLKALLVNGEDSEHEYTANTFLVGNPDEKANGANTYVASIAFDRFQELHKATNIPDRIRTAGTFGKWFGRSEEVFKKVDELIKAGYTGFEEALIACWWTSDHDAHSGNIGIDTKTKRFLNIDHAGGLLDLSPDIRPHRHGLWPTLKRLCRFEPTYHIHEFRSGQRVSEKMADAIMKYTSRVGSEGIEGIKRIVDEEIDQIREKYKDDFASFRSFAHRVGVRPLVKMPPQDLKKAWAETIDASKQHLTSTMYARLQSLRQFGLEMKTSLCFDYDTTQKKFIISDTNRERLAQFIRDNPNYYKQPSHHFRGHSNRQRRGSFLYHVFGNHRFGNGREIERLLQEETKRVLDSEPVGIRKLLMKDFDVPVNQRAEYYKKRLSILKAIMDIPEDHALAKQIDHLREYLGRYSGDRRYNEQLIQLCDQAYSLIARTYEAMPMNIEKMKIYEIFHDFYENPLQLANFDKHQFDTHRIHFLDVADAKLSKMLSDTAGQLESLSTGIEHSRERKQQMPEYVKSVEPLREALKTFEDVKQGKHGGPRPIIQSTREKLDRAEAGLRAGQKPPSSERKQQAFSARPIPLPKTDKSFVEDAAAFFENNRGSVAISKQDGTKLTEPYQKTHVGQAPTPDTAVLMANPCVEANRTQPDSPRSGCLVATEKKFTHMLDFEDPELSIATALTNALIKHTTLNAKNSGDVEKLRKYIQEKFVDALQAKQPNPEFVTKDNIHNDLIAKMEESKEFGFTLPNKKRAGLFNVTASTEDVARNTYKAYSETMHWNPRIIAWAHIWFETMKESRPDGDIKKVMIENNGGNSEFAKMLLIYAAYVGAKNYNFTGYKFTPSATDIARLKDIIENRNNPQHREVMRYTPDYPSESQDLESKTRDVSASTMMSSELRTVLLATKALVDGTDPATLVGEKLKEAQAALRSSQTSLRERDPGSVNPASKELMESIDKKLEEIAKRLDNRPSI